MSEILNSTQNIIRKLGYEKSKNLYYFDSIDKCAELSFHDRKVLLEIKPCAFLL